MSGEKYLIVIIGPTAVGKTSISIQIANHFQTEIISADSRQFYKQTTIGTAKPSDGELKLIPHHFI
ncbi:MAG: tRNA (adenosine(37)-N6)-dimethylallyltransferase MiaA, partial [Ignavibacteria bacterium]|nr:tRNA (adenosine(37)-N6)-dimethylallyltransferase MiaA [Ignavibacteria bacterium]